ncbi:MAG: phosphate ABC transporter ATP-binding protein [Planctomycetes bacterium]|nr:phosphate ABC transporter ATP-binding protein [Planctomycetota bacterium]
MIATRDLAVAYGGRTVVRKASVEAKPGCVLALVGPSGSGKTSFLTALNRLTDMIPGASVSGRVTFDGRDIHDLFPTSAELRRHVGMIFQKPNPFAMSIRRNIELALFEHGERRRGELRRITESVLRDVGLWDEVHDRLDHSALDLSGGQQQRLCIARALALRPRVLLMDEPCSALDPIAAERVEGLIRAMRGHYTIVIVTHNLAQARRLSDHVAVFWMRDGAGEIIEQGETGAVFERSSHEVVASYLSGRRG